MNELAGRLIPGKNSSKMAGYGRGRYLFLKSGESSSLGSLCKPDRAVIATSSFDDHRGLAA